MRQVALVWVLVGLCAAQIGCAQQLVELRSRPQNPLAEKLKLYARRGPKPSERTAQLLRRYDLTGEDRHPSKQLAALAEIHEKQPGPETCYALAELSYIAGKKRELKSRRQALGYFWQTVTQSHAFLFDPCYAASRNPYDPRFRGACDLYNGALESCLRIAQKEGLFNPGQAVTFEMAGRTLTVSVEPKGFRWKPEEFDRFRFTSDYELKGLTNKHQTFGLGVPLIAVRKRGTASAATWEQYYADGLSFPVTAFLRFDPHLPARAGHRTATLELYDPLETTEMIASGRRVPLQSDISTPLAYFLNNPAMRHLDTVGLLYPGRVEKVSGLYMVQPYQPGKIPVLMVHGLWSSPMTWMEMFNDLQADPEIRRRYQFWFYLYPSGKPFWEVAADLREDLAELRDVFDPAGAESACDEMVLVGHSMGGLIARLLTLEGGNRYWGAVSNKPLELIDASDEIKRRIEQVYFFEPDDAVSRVVTIGTPHRGSDFANRWTRWLARRLITLPRDTLETTLELLGRNPGILGGPEKAIVNTSIDSLSPNSPILQAMLETPEPPGVKYHNIVGVVSGGWFLKDTDGVVPYPSAHRDDVDSEIVVGADHSNVHRHPRAALELQRILLEHLRQRSNRRSIRPPVHHAADPASIFGH